MKKAGKIIVIVAAVIVVLAVIGNLLGGSGDDTEETRAVAENTQEAEEGQTNGAPEEPEQTEEPAAGLPAIAEQVLVDQNGVKITATGLEEDGIWGVGLKLLIENSTDQDLGISCDAVIVNNYMIANLFSATVAAGMKSNEISTYLEEFSEMAERTFSLE